MTGLHLPSYILYAAVLMRLWLIPWIALAAIHLMAFHTQRIMRFTALQSWGIWTHDARNSQRIRIKHMTYLTWFQFGNVGGETRNTMLCSDVVGVEGPGSPQITGQGCLNKRNTTTICCWMCLFSILALASDNIAIENGITKLNNQFICKI